MTNQDNRPMDPADLWQKAEAFARERASRSPEDSAALTPEQIRKTLHELRVHQIELEVQNEELHKAQAQIEAGRARYFDLYDLAPVGHCTLSEKGLILEANLTAATLLGMARDALIKLPIYRFILEDDQDIYYLHRKKLIETGELQECELRLVKPDGVRFWAQLTATAVQTEDGAPVCRVVLSDITDRKEAIESLQESEERFKTIIENLPGGVFTQDFDGRLLLVNEIALKNTGYPLKELLSLNVSDIDFGGYTREDREKLWNCLSTGEALTIESSHTRKDRSKYPAEIHLNAIMLDKKPAILAIAFDITERKQMETRLQQAHKMEVIGACRRHRPRFQQHLVSYHRHVGDVVG